MAGVKEVGLVFLQLCGILIFITFLFLADVERQRRVDACPNANVVDKHNAPVYASLVLKKYRDRPNHNEKWVVLNK